MKKNYFNLFVIAVMLLMSLPVFSETSKKIKTRTQCRYYPEEEKIFIEEYDIDGKLCKKIYYPDNENSQDIQTYQYDDKGRLTRIDYANGDYLIKKYDDKDRVKRIDYSDGTYSIYAYSKNGVISTITEYDSEGQIVILKECTVYDTDSSGLLYEECYKIYDFKYKDIDFEESRYEYDENNNLVKESYERSGMLDLPNYFYFYDEEGLLKEMFVGPNYLYINGKFKYEYTFY